MSALDKLERAKGGPFTYRYGGQVRGLPSPAEIPPLLLIELLQRGCHGFRLPTMPNWKADALFQRWVEHFDLPDPQSAGRLQYVVERYSNALEFDLRVHAAGADLGELWRARRWRYLLNLIDHLPGHSNYSMAVSQDEEHAAMLAEAIAKRPETEDKGPSLTSWTPEVSVLADVVDELRAVRHTLVMVNSEKGKAPKAPQPYPRPKSALAKARQQANFRRRQASHESLAARLLPHKQPGWEAPKEPEPAPKPASPGTEYLRRKARALTP